MYAEARERLVLEIGGSAVATRVATNEARSQIPKAAREIEKWRAVQSPELFRCLRPEDVEDLRHLAEYMTAGVSTSALSERMTARKGRKNLTFSPRAARNRLKAAAALLGLELPKRPIDS